MTVFVLVKIINDIWHSEFSFQILTIINLCFDLIYKKKNTIGIYAQTHYSIRMLSSKKISLPS